MLATQAKEQETLRAEKLQCFPIPMETDDSRRVVALVGNSVLKYGCIGNNEWNVFVCVSVS